MNGGKVVKGGKTNRKFGRKKNKPAQKRYTLERRWIKNKARKLKRYMKKFPNYPIPEGVSKEVRNMLDKI